MSAVRHKWEPGNWKDRCVWCGCVRVRAPVELRKVHYVLGGKKTKRAPECCGAPVAPMRVCEGCLASGPDVQATSWSDHMWCDDCNRGRPR